MGIKKHLTGLMPRNLTVRQTALCQTTPFRKTGVRNLKGNTEYYRPSDGRQIPRQTLGTLKQVNADANTSEIPIAETFRRN